MCGSPDISDSLMHKRVQELSGALPSWDWSSRQSLSGVKLSASASSNVGLILWAGPCPARTGSSKSGEDGPWPPRSWLRCVGRRA